MMHVVTPILRWYKTPMKTALKYIAVLCLMVAGKAYGAVQATQGFCTVGGVKVSVSGLFSTTTVQASYPLCTVTVYLTGTTTPATIYSNGSSTPLSNPFTASSNGSWLFYSTTGIGVDVVLSGGIPIPFSVPYTLVDIVPGGSGGTGTVGSGTAGQVAQYLSSGNNIGGVTVSGDATLAIGGALTLATVNSGPGTCGDATHVAQIGVNGKGLTTSCTAVAISFPSVVTPGGSNFSTQYNAGGGVFGGASFNGIGYFSTSAIPTVATGANVVSLFTGSCSSTTALLGNGTCGILGGTGTVTTFTAGSLSPLFTTSVATATTTPALTFALSNAAQNSIFAGPPSGGAGLPSYQTAPAFDGINVINVAAASITGLVTAGTNITVNGSGTLGSPYVVNSSSASVPCGTNGQIQFNNSSSCGGSAATLTSAGALMVPSTTNLKFLLGSPTATFAGSIGGAEGNCPATFCNVLIDAASTDTGGYGFPVTGTYINDLRYGASHTYAYNWGGPGFGNPYVNVENCTQDTVVPTLTPGTGSFDGGCRIQNSLFTYPGYATGNGPGQGNIWYVPTAQEYNFQDWGAGLANGLFFNNLYKNGISDFSGIRGYQHCRSGFLVPNDEGCKGVAWQIIQSAPMPTAMVNTATVNGTNQTVLALTGATAVYNLGVGLPLIDISRGVSSGVVTAVSIIATGSPLVMQYGRATVTGFTPAVSSCGSLSGAISTPSQPINSSTIQTIAMTGLASAWLVGDWATVVGNYRDTFQVISITSAFSGGNQTVTGLLTYPHTSGELLCARGLQGYAEQTQFTNSGNYRYLMYVVGAPSTSPGTIFVTTPYASNGGSNFLTIAGSGYAGRFTGAINVYSIGGTLVDVRNAGNHNIVDGAQLIVSPNPGGWVNGDTVENDDVVSAQFTGLSNFTGTDNKYANMQGVVSSFGTATENAGVLFSGGIQYATSQLQHHGGLFSPPVTLQNAAETAGGMVLFSAPEGGNVAGVSGSSIDADVIYVGPASSGSDLNGVYNIWQDRVFFDAINYSQQTGVMTLKASGNVDLNSTKIMHLANPTAGTDACNLATCGTSALTLANIAAGTAPSSSGNYDFNNNNLITSGSIGSSALLYTTSLGTANSGANFGSYPIQLNDSIWNGTVATPGFWNLADSPGTGTNPPTNLVLSYFGGTSGAKQLVVPGLSANASIFAATLIQAPAISATGTVNGPIFNATTLYSAAGTPLPGCAGGTKGEMAVVSDATTPTYLAAYVSGGAIVAPVLCNGTSWVTH